MALPTSGPLSINDIRVELAASATNQSLGAFSDTAGFTAPDAISDFYGFDGGGIGTGFNSNIGTGFDSALFGISIKSSSNRLLIGGLFTNFNGNTRNSLVELEFDGIEDTGFYTKLGSGFNQAVRAFDFSTTDGSTTVGGDFTVFNGNNRNRLVRLDIVGNEVTSFYTNLGAGFNSEVMSIKRTPINSEDKMVVGGTFTTLNSLTRNRLVRLNANGTEDAAFYTNLGTGFNSDVFVVSYAHTNGYYVGGNFTSLNNNTRGKFTKILTSGQEDLTFAANFTTGFNNGVKAIQPVPNNGGALVGGFFTSLNGLTRNRLVKINTSGAEDTSFYGNLGAGFDNPNSIIKSIEVIVLVTDATYPSPYFKYLVGGTFTTFKGLTRNRLVLLNPDGTEDTAFNTNLGTGFNNSVYSATQLSNGKIIVGGSFTTFNGTNRNKIVALNSDGTLSTT